MDVQTVRQLMVSWRRLAGTGPSASHAHDYLQAALRSLMPEDGEAAAAVMVDGAPAVLVVSAGGLLVATVPLETDGETVDDEPVVVSVRRLPLATGGVHVFLDDDLRGKTGSGKPAHVRTWKFTWPDGPSIEFEAVVELYDGWRDADPAPDHLGRAIAAMLGWAIPTDEDAAG